MSREALYRRYRPGRFRDVVGQSTQVTLLREAVRRQQLSHAYLLAGPRGTGKTSVARILAQAATCEEPEEGEPCGRCGSCQAFLTHRHLDVVEIDGASNRGIDEVRDLRDLVLHAPAMGARKVYIVDEVHMLTEAAFNAFLKTLEEPPPHVVFIFATTEPHKVPITVMSRCQRYDFHRIEADDIVKQLAYILAQEDVTWEEEALRRIAEASDGGLRDAESLLDQVLAGGEVTRAAVDEVLGALDPRELTELTEAMQVGSLPTVLELVDHMYAMGRDPRQMLRDVARRLRDAWAAAIIGGKALRVSSGQWFQALDALAESEGRLRGSFPPRLVIELGLLKAADALRMEGAESAAGDPDPAARLRVPDPVARPIRSPGPIAGPPPEAATPETPPRAVTLDQPSPPEKPREPAANVADTRGDDVPAESPSLRPVLDRLRKRRQLTAAVFRDARVEVSPVGVTIWFRYPAHYAMLDDDKSGHRQAFLASFREVHGDVPVTFEIEPDREDTRDPMLIRIQEVFGESVPVRVTGASPAG